MLTEEKMEELRYELKRLFEALEEATDEQDIENAFIDYFHAQYIAFREEMRGRE